MNAEVARPSLLAVVQSCARQACVIGWMPVVLRRLHRVQNERHVAPVGLVTRGWPVAREVRRMEAKGLHMEIGYPEIVPGASNFVILNIGSPESRPFERVALVAILTRGRGGAWRELGLGICR